MEWDSESASFGSFTAFSATQAMFIGKNGKQIQGYIVAFVDCMHSKQVPRIRF